MTISTTGIRVATVDDLDVVERLEVSVFRCDELSRRSLRYYLVSPTARFLVLETQDGIVGDAIVAVRKGSRLARLYSIAVRTDQAGRGYGRRLLLACEAAAVAAGCTSLRLEVRDNNHAAIRLYESSGYVGFGVFPDYYEDGTAALRFEKPLARATSVTKA